MLKSKFIALVVILFLSTIAFGQSTGSIKGKVKSEKGKSLAGVSIEIRKDGKGVKTGKTDRKGKFKISGLLPGKYNVVFEKDGFNRGVMYGVLVKRKKSNNLGSRLVLKVDQGTLVIIEASVFSPSGFSIYGAEVIVESIGQDGVSKRVGKSYTSRDGDVLFRFPTGSTRYRVTAKGKKASASKIIEIEDAGIYRTAITLDLSSDKK